MNNYELIDLTVTPHVDVNTIRRLIKKDRPSVLRCESSKQVPNYLSILKNDFAEEKVSLLQRPLKLTNASEHGKFVSTTVKDYFQTYAHTDAEAEHDWIILSPLNEQKNMLKALMPELYWQVFPQKHDLLLWITPKHGFTGTHFDSTETFNLQLHGTKKFILYPPGIRRYNARSPLTGFGHTSHFTDFEKVDLNTHPKWQHNVDNKIEVNLKPGEIIYIPPGWWHQVYNDHSLSINGLLNFYTKKKLFTKPYILFDLTLKKLKQKKFFRKLL